MTFSDWQQEAKTWLAQNKPEDKEKFLLRLSDIIRQGRENFEIEKVRKTFLDAKLLKADVDSATYVSNLSMEVLQKNLPFLVLKNIGQHSKPKDQAQWAEIALREKLTGTALVRCIRAGKFSPDVATISARGLPSFQALGARFTLVFKRQGPINRWSDLQKKEAIEALKPMANLFHELINEK